MDFVILYVIVAICVIFLLCIVGCIAMVYEVKQMIYEDKKERLEDLTLVNGAIQELYQNQKMLNDRLNLNGDDFIPERI